MPWDDQAGELLVVDADSFFFCYSQTFALFPWLTGQGNVEVVLTVPTSQRRRRIA